MQLSRKTYTPLYGKFEKMGCSKKHHAYNNESFQLIRPNLREIRSRTDPDLASLLIFYLFQKK